MKLTVVAFIMLSFSVSGQNLGARITALGSSGVALQDYWSARKNQAGLSMVNKVIAAVHYEQRFIDQDITAQSALFIVPKFKNVFALTFSRYGFPAYNEQLVSLAGSRKWGGLSLGIGFNYHLLKVQNYGSSDAVSFDVGLQYQLNNRITIGAHAANPTRNSFNHSVQALVPVRIAFGTALTITDKVLLTTEVEQRLQSVTSLKFGAEYRLIEWFALRGGVSSNPLQQYFGFGIKRRQFQFDAATHTQYYLGFVPQVGLSYEF